MNEPMRPVLVASDLQASSRPVLQLAGHLARAADAELFLVHVVEPKTAGPVPRNVPESQLDRSRVGCERALQLQAEGLEKAGTRVVTGLVVDRPAHEAILQRIADCGAALVIAGSAARKGRGHRLGSTADRLLRSSPVPCLIVRGRAELPVTKVAAATDFSSHSRAAIRVAARWIELLGEAGMHLDLVHAAYRSSLDFDPSLEELLGKKLDREADRVSGGPDAARTGAQLHFGDHPVETLIEAAEKEGYQLLVAGTHGHGRVRRALIGSVAMGLAQSAPCPVLIVPPRVAG